MHVGGLRTEARELRVGYWLDADGKAMDTPLRLADLGEGYKILFCFQHWCPGCHSHGFPALQFLHRQLADRGVGFAVIQTVFEGAEVNTTEQLRVNQQRYGLKIPFGQDEPPAGARYPTFMEDYRSGGTPWFTVIDPRGEVVFADFRLDAQRLVEAFDGEDFETA